MDKLENTYDLIAAVYRQALKDAARGDQSAIYFLDVCCPDWRKRAQRPPKRMRVERPAVGRGEQISMVCAA